MNDTGKRLTRRRASASVVFSPALLSCAAAFSFAPSFALAQAGTPSVSQPVVQAVPGREQLQLNAALSKLARDPRNVEALLSAGAAARGMGDFDAAVGFYRRALQVSAKDVRAKTGLASALVQSGDAYAALPLFQEAEAAGANPATTAPDKGLAYDLTGNPAMAQRYYRAALFNNEDAEVRRRLAISQAISGDRRGMEGTLASLLQQQDKAAWRARAFALAILGKTEDSIKITETILPKSIAQGISPFLSYMPRLTPAQQAAAANLGKFPRASEIGRDDPRVAQAALPGAAPTRVAQADAGLVPQGAALGTPSATGPARTALRPSQAELPKPASRAAERAGSSRRVAPPEPRPERTDIVSAAPAPVPASPVPAVPAPAAPAAPAPAAPQSASQLLAAATPQQPAPSEKPAPAPSVAASTPASPPPSPATPMQASAPASTPALASTPAPAQAAAMEAGPAPGFDLAKLPSSVLAAAEGRPPPATAPVPAPGFSMGSVADAFGDLGAPVAEVAPVSGAVDIRTVKPAKVEPAPESKPDDKAEVKAERGSKAAAAKLATAKAPVKPAPPSHPSRIWVQIGVGQSKAAIDYDWRKLAKKYPDVFKGRKVNVSDMGRTNRMLIGPFASMKEANAFLATLKKVDVAGPHVWTSPAGQVVDAI